jgi:hypothetical protein
MVIYPAAEKLLPMATHVDFAVLRGLSKQRATQSDAVRKK